MRLDTEPQIPEELRKNMGLAIALGILMMILGIAAIANPFLTALAATVLFGWLFIIGGIVRLIHAFQTRRDGGLVWNLIVSLLYIGAGILLLRNPLRGGVALTLVLGLLLLIKGIFQVILALQLRPLRNWIWVLVGGILEIALGIIIWNQGPVQNLLLLGLLVGIDLLFEGVWMISLTSGARRRLTS
ncbi:hypothetical protein BZZ01_12175 [Nostocales cyanobacterium HT-58-2]|nr:hypothetical protein BZZ01_12175 [Nostocales cyanobacterium HT-58-2]